MTAATPGPYVAMPHANGNGDFDIVANGGKRRVALVWVRPGEVQNAGLGTETFDTAQMFAAAPDLLAACSAYMAHIDATEDDPRVSYADERRMLADMRAAIAKATGE